MQDIELHAFLAIFEDLLKVFPKRADDVEGLSKAYFSALRGFTISQLRAGADVWIQRGKFFPKPGEWREAIPQGSRIELAEMSPAEASAHIHARARGYEGEPCHCQACVAAGVTHRFVRHVPDYDADGNDVRMLLNGIAVTRGHWAHGEELVRFYAAKEAFTADYLKLIAAIKTMPRVNQKQIDVEKRDEVCQ